MDKYYVVTKYWNNGEWDWERNKEREKPVAVYKDLNSLRRNVESNNYVIFDDSDIGYEEHLGYIYEFKKATGDDIERFVCPYDLEMQTCQEECIENMGSKEDYWSCLNQYDSEHYDSSYTTYRVYEVSNSLKEELI